ncbi:MAG: DNA-binding XRE family transcriptional regulator [Planctomycetota bacterium]|jgi:DNA-binding XRE family transcriptional regulator
MMGNKMEDPLDLVKARQPKKGRVRLGKKAGNSRLVAFIKKARSANEWTQAELALRAGVSTHTIRNIEQGSQKAKIETLNKILSCFGFELGAVKKSSESRLAKDVGQ